MNIRYPYLYTSTYKNWVINSLSVITDIVLSVYVTSRSAYCMSLVYSSQTVSSDITDGSDKDDDAYELMSHFLVIE